MSQTIAEQLRLGIEAARAGRTATARKCFVAVLNQEPNNVPAMLWLAFVLPSPQDSIRLLERVLTLEPTNERAKDGLRWARGRLDHRPDESAPTARAPDQFDSPAESSGESGSEISNVAPIRQRLLSNKIQRRAKKGALAQRARRTINPLLVIIFVTGIVGIISIGVGALSFVPPDVLAAWLPNANSIAFTGSAAVPVKSEIRPVESIEVPTESDTGNFSSHSDPLAIKTDPPAEQPLAASRPSPSSAQAELATHVTEAESASEPELFSVDLSSLVGPALPAIEAEAIKPVDNLLLAHQPAYPGEKWIEVNVTTQQITAWEGDKPIFSFTGSTGLPNTPTVLGEFHIYWKLESALMVGPDYYLPEVPYTMYFYRGYALHGTYWHSNFGQPMSHGCVNLETGDAQRLFEWADPVIPPGQNQVTATADNPGTLVVVHD